jgi:hypothetical protein
MAMSIPATMRALQQTSLNGPQDLRLITDLPVPAPGPGDVLIRVTTAADLVHRPQDLCAVPVQLRPGIAR